MTTKAQIAAGLLKHSVGETTTVDTRPDDYRLMFEAWKRDQAETVRPVA